MIQSNKKTIRAIDLMILDIKTAHPNIRTQAKNSDCEQELNELKDMILEYLIDLRILHNYEE